ncbi:MAG: hypothetical protein ACUZ8E_05330 [Candidatus Anammoxibacter sp.]
MGTRVALEAPASTREYGSNNTLIVTCQLEAELLEQARSQARAWERVAMELNSLNSYKMVRYNVFSEYLACFMRSFTLLVP